MEGEKIERFIWYEFQLGHSVAQAVQNINKVFGENMVDYRSAQDLYEKFRGGQMDDDVEIPFKKSRLQEKKTTQLLNNDICEEIINFVSGVPLQKLQLVNRLFERVAKKKEEKCLLLDELRIEIEDSVMKIQINNTFSYSYKAALDSDDGSFVSLSPIEDFDRPTEGKMLYSYWRVKNSYEQIQLIKELVKPNIRSRNTYFNFNAFFKYIRYDHNPLIKLLRNVWSRQCVHMNDTNMDDNMDEEEISYFPDGFRTIYNSKHVVIYRMIFADNELMGILDSVEKVDFRNSEFDVNYAKDFKEDFHDRIRWSRNMNTAKNFEINIYGEEELKEFREANRRTKEILEMKKVGEKHYVLKRYKS